MQSTTIYLLILVVLILGAIGYIEKSKPKRVDSTISSVTSQTNYPKAKELVNPSGFINTEPFKIEDYIGKKVILLDIWTYSCINCQRTLPYITAWDEKYKDQGLLVIGIHSPEFEFEKDIENVRKAVEKFGIEYPVVLDNDFGTWRAYQNSYWPRKYLIDINGDIVYDHIGEGGYKETEKKIQELLEDRAKRLAEDVAIPSDTTTVYVEDAITDFSPRSPETYFGAWRNENIGNIPKHTEGGYRVQLPEKLLPDTVYLDGAWNVHREYMEVPEGGAKLVYKYRAQKVFMVASAPEGGSILLLQDGAPLGDACGDDCESDNTTVKIKEETLYKLVDNPDGSKEHILEIYFDTPGVRIFTFTFG